jgi:arylsulfatase A-like enzyme
MRVLYVDIDSLRPDHLGCYGYGRDTSPTIDALAADGVRFDECYVSDSPCLPSRTALATCRHGIDSGVVTHFGEGQWYDEPGEGHDPDPERRLSFRHLLEHGVHTTTVTSFSQRHLAYHFTASFQEHIQPSAKTGSVANEDADEVTDAATTWLDSHATEDDWLLHVNYWDVHHPYEGITPFVDEVCDSGPAAAWPDQDAIDAQQGSTGPRTTTSWPTPSTYGTDRFETVYDEWPFPERVETRADAEQFVDGYDAAIRKVDAEVETLLATLEAAGVREETAVVITGDHGEAFGEHGIYAEHAFPHRACQRVPLVVSWPGVTDDAAGTAVEEFVHQFDLMPTLCDLFDAPTPSGWDAEPFTSALRGESFDGRPFLVCGHGIYTFGRAVYEGDWTYIRLLHPGVFSAPGLYNDPDLPGEGLELLHHLGEDPHMTDNRIADEPAVADRLRARLDGWLADRVSTNQGDHRPVETRGRDPLARMCSSGPYLYYDPDDLLGLYRELDRSDEQIAGVERSLSAFPRDGN